jgi:hypothetical protein
MGSSIWTPKITQDSATEVLEYAPILNPQWGQPRTLYSSEKVQVEFFRFTVALLGKRVEGATFWYSNKKENGDAIYFVHFVSHFHYICVIITLLNSCFDKNKIDKKRHIENRPENGSDRKKTPPGCSFKRMQCKLVANLSNAQNTSPESIVFEYLHSCNPYVYL